MQKCVARLWVPLLIVCPVCVLENAVLFSSTQRDDYSRGQADL